ncbi:hypothetical protein TNIN_493901 [Trichonephila inaurata madagascariensis]|uniref:Uncharacterized protein n=1 Tax=Trichonephila inaurata madagascariensis TaxID=2747483 RepID=A0A8X6WNV0_9ARAC|nr:hypothetical protein TNIN_493901 [Trichonephila inaurata madagascariensis]
MTRRAVVPGLKKRRLISSFCDRLVHFSTQRLVTVEEKCSKKLSRSPPRKPMGSEIQKLICAFISSKRCQTHNNEPRTTVQCCSHSLRAMHRFFFRQSALWLESFRKKTKAHSKAAGKQRLKEPSKVTTLI